MLVIIGFLYLSLLMKILILIIPILIIIFTSMIEMGCSLIHSVIKKYKSICQVHLS